MKRSEKIFVITGWGSLIAFAFYTNPVVTARVLAILLGAAWCLVLVAFTIEWIVGPSEKREDNAT